MTYEMYRYIFIGGLIGCGIFFAIAVVLFFTLNIPKVISDLSGRTARKAIENIRRQNEESGDKGYQTSAVNRERGKLTDKISPSGRLAKQRTAPLGAGAMTEKIGTQKLAPAGETDVLSDGGETTLLSEPAGETTVLGEPAGETSVLAEPMGETAVLTPQEPVQQPSAAQEFSVEFEITFVHTSEVIC